MNDRNKEIKTRRMMTYFMDAAEELSRKDGFDRLTLRTIADAAGYNSATMYNYFHNLEELLAFTVLRVLSAFWQEVSRETEVLEDPLLRYCQVWIIQGRHAYRNPELFHYLFQLNDRRQVYGFLDDYYRHYPKEYESLSDSMKTLVHETRFNQKNRLYIQPCIQQGDFSEENAGQVVEFGHLVFNGVLFQVLHDKEHIHDYAYYNQLFLRAFLELMRKRVNRYPERLDQLAAYYGVELNPL